MATKKKNKKAKKRTIRRTYNGNDSYMLEQGQTLLDLFAEDKADFIIKVTDLADPFAENWQDAIDAAIAYTDDHVVIGQIAPKTGTVLENMEAGKNKYSEIIFYAERKFGKISPLLKEFGKGAAYTKAARSQEKMFQFLDELSTTANKYKTDLGTKGCTQGMIDEIGTIRDALNTSNRTQNLAIKGRPVISEGRTKVYNTAYGFARKVIDAAQQVYKTEPAKLGQYTYNPPVHHRNQITIEFDAPAGVVTNIDLETVKNKKVEMVQFTATGSPFLVYAANEPDAEPGTGPNFTITPGTPVEKTPAQIQVLSGGIDTEIEYLDTKNTGTTTGHLKVVFKLEKKK